MQKDCSTNRYDAEEEERQRVAKTVPRQRPGTGAVRDGADNGDGTDREDRPTADSYQIDTGRDREHQHDGEAAPDRCGREQPLGGTWRAEPLGRIDASYEVVVVIGEVARDLQAEGGS